jgi:hypothetical protein
MNAELWGRAVMGLTKFQAPNPNNQRSSKSQMKVEVAEEPFRLAEKRRWPIIRL